MVKSYINFGDYVNQYIAHKVGYEWPANLLGCGTLLDYNHISKIQNEEVIIWGSGAGSAYAGMPDKKYIYRSVRGPLSQEKLGDKSIPMGDPGFLIPIFVERNFKTDRIVYVPHWYNYERRIDRRIFPEVGCDLVIDPKKHIKHITHDISSAGFVMTNSLHGAIFAQAYGIPWAPVKTKREQMPDKVKWRDLFRYLEIGIEPYWVSSIKEAEKWWEDHGKKIKPPNIGAILSACPFEDKILSFVESRRQDRLLPIHNKALQTSLTLP